LAIELAAEVEGLVHLRRAFADADGEHGAHASIGGAPQHLRAITRVARAVKVGVRIDQQA
jgi:hypothetical protein